MPFACWIYSFCKRVFFFVHFFFLFHLLFRGKDCRLETIWHRVQTNIHKAMSSVTSGVHQITYIHISFLRISYIFNDTQVIWFRLCIFGIQSIIEMLLKWYFIALLRDKTGWVIEGEKEKEHMSAIKKWTCRIKIHFHWILIFILSIFSLHVWSLVVVSIITNYQKPLF